MSTPALTSNQELHLFVVTLLWNRNNLEEGDFCENVWAADENEAILKLATIMSEHPDAGGFDSEEDRVRFVLDLVDNAGPYAAERFSESVLPDIRELLSGPEGKMSEAAQRDFNAVAEILAKHGINNPWAAVKAQPTRKMKP